MEVTQNEPHRQILITHISFPSTSDQSKNVNESISTTTRSEQSIHKKNQKDLREGGALSPDATVLADDGGGSEVISGAFDVAH